MYYVHIGDLLTLSKVEEDGTLLTQSGEIPVRIGDMIVINEFGNSQVVPEDTFNEYYKPVKKIRKSTTRKTIMSPFEEAYAKQLLDFNLDNTIEDEQYISGTYNLSKNNI